MIRPISKTELERSESPDAVRPSDYIEYIRQNTTPTDDDISEYFKSVQLGQPERPDGSEDSDVSQCDDTPDVYAFTINVYPNKQFNRRPWCKFTKEEQKAELDVLLLKALKMLNLKDFDFAYELTKCGNVHVHGMFQGNKDIADMFQHIVCKRLGLPNVSADRCCKMVKTLFSPRAWQDYMRKDQGLL